MSMLADQVEVVIGVDTHKHTHTAAVVRAATGAIVARAAVTADPDGYTQLEALAGSTRRCGPGRWKAAAATAPGSPDTWRSTARR